MDLYIHIIFPQLSPLQVTEGKSLIHTTARHIADMYLVYILGTYIHELSPLRVTEVYILGFYRL